MTAGLSAGQGIANPGDDIIPLTFLGRRVIDQHAVDVARCKVAAVVPDYSARLLARRPRGIFVSEFEQGKMVLTCSARPCNLGLEGLVSKRRDRQYRAGRSEAIRRWNGIAVFN